MILKKQILLDNTIKMCYYKKRKSDTADLDTTFLSTLRKFQAIASDFITLFYVTRLLVLGELLFLYFGNYCINKNYNNNKCYYFHKAITSLRINSNLVIKQFSTSFSTKLVVYFRGLSPIYRPNTVKTTMNFLN